MMFMILSRAKSLHGIALQNFQVHRVYLVENVLEYVVYKKSRMQHVSLSFSDRKLRVRRQTTLCIYTVNVLLSDAR